MAAILHVVPGLDDPTNGIAAAARILAARQGAALADARDAAALAPAALRAHDEVWVHSMWLPRTLVACGRVLRARRGAAGPLLVRMPHGCLDPLRLAHHRRRKAAVAPLERWLLRRADRVESTSPAEDRWIAAWCPGARVARCDLLGDVRFAPRPGLGRSRFLYVGRLHPLKGVDALIAAVRLLAERGELPPGFRLDLVGRDEEGTRAGLERAAAGLPVRFLGELDAASARREIAAADRLVLPTLSENFGLVVREALELGVPAITTDGAEVWAGRAGVAYLEGYVAAAPAARAEMLAAALLKS